MKKSLLSVLVLVASALPAQAQTGFDAANHALATAQYAEAIRNNELLIAQGVRSTAIYANLADAYRASGDLAHAVLNDARSAILAPRDPAVRAHFEVKIAPWERAARTLSMNEWSIVASVGFLTLLMGICTRVLGKKRFSNASVLVGVCLFSIAVLSLVAWAPALSEGVVIEATPVLVSPFEGAQQQAMASLGEVVHLLEAHGDFVSVNGGWIRTDHVQRVID